MSLSTRVTILGTAGGPVPKLHCTRGKSDLSWSYSDADEAFLENFSSRFECTKHNYFNGGDRSIIVGKVKKQTIDKISNL